MIAIIDYDAGNMKSVEKALHFLEKEVLVTRNREEILNADHVILPGVGAFGMAMEQLREYDLEEVIHAVVRKGTPFLGGIAGLGLLKGTIKKIPKGEYVKIPHMGWNSLSITPERRLFQGIGGDPYVYFVHSYYIHAKDRDVVAATTNYNVTIDAAIETGNLFGCQFHPEKSSETGLAILKNFVNLQ